VNVSLSIILFAACFPRKPPVADKMAVRFYDKRNGATATVCVRNMSRCLRHRYRLLHITEALQQAVHFLPLILPKSSEMLDVGILVFKQLLQHRIR
jgi:hypothetical protein